MAVVLGDRGAAGLGKKYPVHCEGLDRGKKRLQNARPRKIKWLHTCRTSSDSEYFKANECMKGGWKVLTVGKCEVNAQNQPHTDTSDCSMPEM
jgi:hypothetical protein